jgi:hypothetical protein
MSQFTAPAASTDTLNELCGGDGLAGALNALDDAASSDANPGHTHTLADGATNVTATYAELNVLDGIPGTLTATELGYVDGVTSAIQTQLDAKEDTVALTASRAVVSTAGGILGVSATTATEIGYVNGVTSAIQTQLGTKAAATSGTLTTPTIVTPVVKTAVSLGALGATPTINWASGDLQQGTLDENVTLAFSNAVAGQRLTLFLLQDGSGTNTIAFTPTIIWQDGITPTWTTTAAKMNVMVIYCLSAGVYYGMGGKFA